MLSFSAGAPDGAEPENDHIDKFPKQVLMSYFPNFNEYHKTEAKDSNPTAEKYLDPGTKIYLNTIAHSMFDNRIRKDNGSAFPNSFVIQCNNSGSNEFIRNVALNVAHEVDADITVITRKDLLRLMGMNSNSPKSFVSVVSASVSNEDEEDDGNSNTKEELVDLLKTAFKSTDSKNTIIALPTGEYYSPNKKKNEKDHVEVAMEHLFKYLGNKPRRQIVLFSDVGLTSIHEQQLFAQCLQNVNSSNVVTVFCWTPDLKEFASFLPPSAPGVPSASIMQRFVRNLPTVNISSEQCSGVDGWDDLMLNGKAKRREEYNESLFESECKRRRLKVKTDPKEMDFSTKLYTRKEAEEIVTLAHGLMMKRFKENPEKNVRIIRSEDLKKAVKIKAGLVSSNVSVIAPNEYEELNPMEKIIKKLKDNNHQLNTHEKRLLGTIVTPEAARVKFKDIASLEKTKESLQSLIALPLLRPSLFQHGVLKDSVSGVLLFGPPGTGKTMLAKALASECGSNFMNITASVIFNMYVGEGEKNVKAIFTLARKIAPCVIFIDELDSIFEARQSGHNMSTKREVVNEFMSEWDGLVSQNEGIVVVGATNRPFDLDDAILRRMPRRILVDIPTEQERRDILKVQLKDELLADDVSLDDLAAKTKMYSGSDLKNVCMHAALNSVKDLLLEENKELQRGDTLITESGVLNVLPESKLLLSSSSFSATEKDKRRILKKQHFDTALQTISSSINEKQKSLEELREWAKKYGELDGNSIVNQKQQKPFGFQK
jgi:SpoVK/Ycf46/Vps4 family AAA+-type ATPase